MNEVEICTGSVKCFCRKMHKIAAITGENLSKLLDYKDQSFWCFIVAKKNFSGIQKSSDFKISGLSSRTYFNVLQSLSKICQKS
jgi:predicted nucleic-acid-binding Zn-ribbon protein